MASKLLAAACFFFILACLLDSTEGWSGHYVRIRRIAGYHRRYCICWYWWWGCSYWRWRWVSYYYYSYRCKAGWTHNGNRNCDIPICRPSCGEHGTCVSPNNCSCDSVATGPTCGTLTCSYRLPCYPGNCYDTNECECDPGFRSETRSEGCLSYDETDETMYPTISKCTVTILHVRRAENRTDYMFIMDGTNQTGVEEVWSNQKRFNVLQFEFETEPPEIEAMSERPAYVFASSFGVAEARVEVNLTKISRSGSPIRDSGTFETFSCPHLSSTNPETGTSNCTIYHDQFKTLIEHGDWMEVRYMAKSGGFRELRNIDDKNKHYSTDQYNGLRSIQQVKFLFDFVAPQSCQLEGAFASCPPNSSTLKVEEEFTRNPIKTYWLGWTDDLSGLAEYYVEIFRLLPDPYGKLVERHPLDPLFSRVVPHADSGIDYPEYTPERSGIYSVLMETRDKSNNSRIARRLVIYDPTSNITINTEENGKFYVSSASEQSNFQWQTRAKDVDGKSAFTVQWSNHFKNRVHEDGRYLNEVLEYPIQFKEIQDDGVLYSQKYVASTLDDYEGELTRRGINNYHGIINFQINLVYTGDTEIPKNGWIDVSPLSESYTFRVTLDDGDSVRIWVRATDVMNNVLADSTLVTLDTTPPGISAINTTQTKLALNYNGDDAKYNYTSRITFEAADGDSGVHEIHYEVVVETFGKNEKVMFKGNQSANFKPEGGVCSSPLDDGYCYRADQTVDLDNCWFMVAKKDLQTSIATVTVTAFNRAMLGTTLKFNIGSINELHGLDSYTGPENFHAEAVSSGGFRLSWTIPDKVSCYGLADIVLLIVSNNKTELVYVPVGATSYEKSTATPNTEYRVSLAMQLQGANRVSSGLELSVRTTEKDKDEGGVPGGVVGGIVVGVIALFAIVLIVFIILVRRGHFQPVRKSVVRAKTIVQRKARETFYGETPHRAHKNEYAYDNRTSELYIYGGMDFDDNQTWHIPRSHVTFETLLKSGRFANIYKAALNRNRKSHETVVAKTLKENFSQDDLMLMKAKINFTATVVGNHPNVVKFIGAVVDDTAMGPFIIYEYCEHGTLKDYLQTQNSNVTVEVQENLFRFGLDIAKGMEFLASKGIVHRRLAARNILLTFLNETKIAGFGPQPSGGSEEDGDSEKGKKERVPIKWMPPECMASTASATEKSDVWSYAVVLWEIFTLGGTPYENIRSRDLPDRLKKGERLHQPEYCDETLGDPDPDDRHDPDDPDDVILSAGAIAGIVIGGIFFLCIVFGIIVECCQKHKIKIKPTVVTGALYLDDASEVSVEIATIQRSLAGIYPPPYPTQEFGVTRERPYPTQKQRLTMEQPDPSQEENGTTEQRVPSPQQNVTQEQP